MRIFFAGADSSEHYNALLRKHNVQNRLESFYSLKNKPFSPGFGMHLLDSGGFVARVKGKAISVKTYANYINKTGSKLCFNLDTADVKETLYNHEFLEKETTAYVIPVYHADDYTNPAQKDLLFRYMDHYPFIALGGIAGTFFDEKERHAFYNFVFRQTTNKIKLHGLGITTIDTLLKYPFYSVDSTTWLSFARFGNSYAIKDEFYRVFLKEKRHYLYCTELEVEFWVEQERFLKQLWQERGYNWNEDANIRKP